MMNGINHGWGMGWGWIVGFLVLVVLIWAVVKVANQNNKSK